MYDLKHILDMLRGVPCVASFFFGVISLFTPTLYYRCTTSKFPICWIRLQKKKTLWSWLLNSACWWERNTNTQWIHWLKENYFTLIWLYAFKSRIMLSSANSSYWHSNTIIIFMDTLSYSKIDGGENQEAFPWPRKSRRVLQAQMHARSYSSGYGQRQAIAENPWRPWEGCGEFEASEEGPVSCYIRDKKLASQLGIPSRNTRVQRNILAI